MHCQASGAWLGERPYLMASTNSRLISLVPHTHERHRASQVPLPPPPSGPHGIQPELNRMLLEKARGSEGLVKDGDNAASRTGSTHDMAVDIPSGRFGWQYPLAGWGLKSHGRCWALTAAQPTAF